MIYRSMGHLPIMGPRRRRKVERPLTINDIGSKEQSALYRQGLLRRLQDAQRLKVLTRHPPFGENF